MRPNQWPNKFLVKPIIILPPGAMSDANMKMLRDNELCVVVAKNPARVKFVDPIPSISSRTQIEDAAIKLSRKILNPGFWSTDSTRAEMTRAFIDILVQGTPLQAGPTREELEKKAFDNEKFDELRRLAREEAKAERKAAKETEQPKP